MLMELFSYGFRASVQLGIPLVLPHVLLVFITPYYQLILFFSIVFLINVSIERKIMLQFCTVTVDQTTDHQLLLM